MGIHGADRHFRGGFRPSTLSTRRLAVSSTIAVKGIFLDITPLFWDGFYTKIAEPSIVPSPARQPLQVVKNELASHRSTVMLLQTNQVRKSLE
jgi:hypothetical protein